MGGWEAGKAEVARGSMSSRDVKFFSRYCGWAPGQLDRVSMPRNGSSHIRCLWLSGSNNSFAKSSMPSNASIS